ncbi:MHS family MFS transporter, partial [Paraburkholderia sp. Se-20369]|nr:MHS family MFS transporter [Paraburkholderia sp. Se-20369]
MQRVLQRERTVKLPLRDVVRDHWPIVLLAAGTLPVINVTYFRSTFALSWATKTLGYAQGTFLGILSISLVVQFFMQPLGAWLVSKIDMRRAMCWILIPEIVLMPVMFHALATRSYWIAVAGMCVSTIPSAMFYGAVGGMLARVFPANLRYTGLSLAYQLSALVVGGGTPVLAQAILNATGSIVGVAIASGLYACVSLACMLALLKRTGCRADELSSAERSDAAQWHADDAARGEPEATGAAGAAGEGGTLKPV